MVWFVLFTIVALVAVALLVIGFRAPRTVTERDRFNREDITKENETRGLTVLAGVACLLVAVIGLFFCSFTVIPTRSVGVTVAFGRPDNESLKNGFHFVKPWSSVEKFDASVQTLKLDAASGKSQDGDLGNCVTVRLANQTTACVDVSVQWNIDPDGDVVELYRKYKSFDNVQNNLVERQLVHALNVAFETYDPLRSINGGGAPAQSLDDLAAKASTALTTAVGSGIKVANLTIPLVHFDNTTQDKLNAYAQALADTRIAEQRKQTALAQKAANDALASGANSNNPGVLYQNCLDMVERLAKEGKGLPAAFSCGAPPATVVPVK
jgi:regulator of protease activity HflC (stomatin/prohibitin superfamily)